MKKIYLAIFVVIALVVVILSACKFNKNQPEKKEKITIGMVTFPGYAPLYLAKEKDLFPSIDVDLVRIESIGDLRAAMNSGKIDMYAATYDIFENMQNSSPPGIGFLAVDESHGADGIAVSNNINTITDLKGKTVGAEPGLPPYFILQYLLNREGLTLKDVNFKDLPSQDAGSAFAANKLDAAGTYEPYLSKAIQARNDAKVLISSANTPHLIVDFLFASENLTKNNPEVLKDVAQGWFTAVNYYKSHQDESIKIMSKDFDVSDQDMKDFTSVVSWLDLNENKYLFNKSEPNNAFATFDLVGDILEKNQTEIYRVKAENKLTDSIINELANEEEKK